MSAHCPEGPLEVCRGNRFLVGVPKRWRIRVSYREKSQAFLRPLLCAPQTLEGPGGMGGNPKESLKLGRQGNRGQSFTPQHLSKTQSSSTSSVLASPSAPEPNLTFTKALPSPSEQTLTPPSPPPEESPTSDLLLLPPVCLSARLSTQPAGYKVRQGNKVTPNGKGRRGPWELLSSTKSFLYNLGPNSLSLTPHPRKPSGG